MCKTEVRIVEAGGRPSS